MGITVMKRRAKQTVRQYAYVEGWAALYAPSEIAERAGRARADRAPTDAVHFSDLQGRWVRIGELCVTQQVEVRGAAARLARGRERAEIRQAIMEAMAS